MDAWRQVAGGEGRSSEYVFYFGGVDGGVWKTTDAGTVWKPIFDNEPVASIGALAVAPPNPNVIYVGTGESDIRSDLSSGDGVYRQRRRGEDLEQYWTARLAPDQPDFGRSVRRKHCVRGRAGARIRPER